MQLNTSVLNPLPSIEDGVQQLLITIQLSINHMTQLEDLPDS